MNIIKKILKQSIIMLLAVIVVVVVISVSSISETSCTDNIESNITTDDITEDSITEENITEENITEDNQENSSTEEDTETTESIVPQEYEEETTNVTYDPQPTTVEAVKEAIDVYADASDEVISCGSPIELYNAVQNAVGAATINITKDINMDSLNTEILDNGASFGNGKIFASIIIPAGKNITITSDNHSRLTRSLQTETDSIDRHFAVKGTLTLQNITLDGLGKSGGVELIIGENINISGGTLYMEKGTIIENCLSISHGGGVEVGARANFTMNGGEIRNCVNVTGPGGGVAAFGARYNPDTKKGMATFIMNGGIISGNKVSANGQGGGGVYVGWANFTMNGGTIIGNAALGTGADSGGGGVRIIARDYFTVPSSFTMNDGTISGNTAMTDGGGVLVLGLGDSGASLTMNGGTIDGNKALNGNGGGVYVTKAGKFTMGSAKISGNSASKGDGGGIYTEIATYLSTGDYTNLTIAEAALFSGNSAQAAYVYTGTPAASNIASRSASFNFAAGTAPFIKHPLNNYDINYIREAPLEVYTVTVEYKNSAGAELLPPVTDQFNKGTEYTYTVPAINGYALADWKQNGISQGNTNPITIFPVTEDIIITLIYEGVTPFGFYKVDAADYKTPLLGAEFKLYSWLGDDDPEGLIPKDTEGSGWELKGTYISNTDSYVDFGGLIVGAVYQLVEIKAPNGYQLPIGQWRITVNADGTISDPVAVGTRKPPAFKNTGVDGGQVYSLGNLKQFAMPLSGGQGTYWLTALGNIMLIGGMLWMGILFCRRLKRKAIQKNRGNKNSLYINKH